MNVFLKNNEFKKFSIASFLSTTGDILFYLALMTYASKLNNYTLALSLIAISESVPKLFSVFGGFLADKTKNKFKTLFLMAVVRFLLYSLVGILFITNISEWNLVIMVIIINFISDTIGSYSTGLAAPLLVNIVGEKDFAEAEGFASGVSEIINTCAQFLGAGLLLFLSYSNLAFINAVTFLLAGFLYVSVGLKHKKSSNEVINQTNDKGFIETMKTSYTQAKKEHGLLTIVLIIALVNGILTTIGALIPIVAAASRSTMIIYNYSFTVALVGVVVGIGATIGSLFGPQLFKKMSIFNVIIITLVLSIMTTVAAFIANIKLILAVYFLMAIAISVGSIKMSQWLVTTVDRNILGSTIGLLNTILLAVAPILTTTVTSLAGVTGVKYALVLLTAIEVITLFVAVRVTLKNINVKKVKYSIEK